MNKPMYTPAMTLAMLKLVEELTAIDMLVDKILNEPPQPGKEMHVQIPAVTLVSMHTVLKAAMAYWMENSSNEDFTKSAMEIKNSIMSANDIAAEVVRKARTW